MTRTRLVALTLATATTLLLGGCGSDASEASDTSTTSATSTPSTAATSAPTSAAPSPTASASPTPTSTASTPATSTGRLIDYEATNEDGILVQSPADAQKLTGAPAAFRRFIAAQIQQQSADEEQGCTEPPQIYVTQVDTGGWARGGYFIPQCGGYAALWAVSGGAWTEAWSGQALVDCATLDRYAFPSRVAGDSCDTGTSARPYRR